MITFKIIRIFLTGKEQTIKSGLTEAQATTHCTDPEANSQTAISLESVRLTGQRGPWFDTMRPEPPRRHLHLPRIKPG